MLGLYIYLQQAWANTPNLISEENKHLFCSIDKKGLLILDGAFFIDSDDLCLLGILNSSFGKYYFSFNVCNNFFNLNVVRNCINKTEGFFVK